MADPEIARGVNERQLAIGGSRCFESSNFDRMLRQRIRRMEDPRHDGIQHRGSKRRIPSLREDGNKSPETPETFPSTAENSGTIARGWKDPVQRARSITIESPLGT